MDYEGAVELISQLEKESPENEEFTIDALKAINNEIKLKDFQKSENDEIAEKIIRSLEPSLFSQAPPKTASSVYLQQQDTRQQIQPKVQPKREAVKQPMPIEKAILQEQLPDATKQNAPVQTAPSVKEVSAATDELKKKMGNASGIKLPNMRFNVKPKEVKQELKPQPRAEQAQQIRQPATVQKQTAAPKNSVGQKATPQQISAIRAKTFKSILVGLPLHDQIDELSKIGAGIDGRAFDKAHMNIIINEISSLYVYSQTEPKTDNVFEQRLRDIRAERLNEVIAKLRRAGVAI
jgi:hypothetical protein